MADNSELEEEQEQDPEVQPYRVLVIDDDQDMRDDAVASIRDALADAGEVDVVAVVSEEEAYKQPVEEFDLVIVDIRLAGAGSSDTGGLRVIREIVSRNPRARVIAVSNYPEQRVDPKQSPIRVGAASVAAGATTFIPRGIEMINWARLLEEWVRMMHQLTTHQLPEGAG